ncbi:sigma-70 family RNA polymerase sigma factor [Roseiconus nitratireducens]|uniref:Sigma-70 family RNA polymerase sigma factor n=1 Tax=Roseiconus nitratireducens TaxID=2605748 RepID=A0A5M6D218_9BACT|nr:sigma-70 family RNA polymerase sigma factor [Roseiconus nitratireducens]KAA5539175.1 sigma-70 family RNA polymerase sigma factor [Roseiconus nitratireducens]
MSEKQPERSAPDATSAGGGFETTHWSAVLLAAKESSAESRQALAELCQAYWLPLYAYVRCRVGDAHRAEDLVQTFFAQLLEKDFLRSVDPDKGRFRAFLLTAMKRSMANQWDRQTALKRGGGTSPLSLDFEVADRHYRATRDRSLRPDHLYLQNWVRTLLERVFERLGTEYEAAGKGEQFRCLKPFIVGDDDRWSRTEVAEQLQCSGGAVRVAVHRLRRRYRQVLREEVAQTVQSPEDVEDEIRSLFQAFA